MIPVYSADEVLAMDIPEREDLIDGLLPRGDAVLFSAREKAGKGLIALDMCASVSTGESFLGRSVTKGPAIYLALEEGRRTVRDRVRARLGGGEGVDLGIAFLDGSDGQTFRLDDHGSIDGLHRLLTERAPLLIVLDVLREAHDGRENESDDMAMLLRPVRQLAHEHNTTIVVTHHASKHGGFRGSTSIAAAFDDTIEFTRDDLDADPQMRGRITARGRDLPKITQNIEFDPDTFRWRSIIGSPIVSMPTNTREAIIAALNATDDWLTAEEITSQLDGVKPKTVQNALSALMGERYRPILVKGTGAKGDPRRFHGIHRHEGIDPECSGNDLGATDEPEIRPARIVPDSRPLGDRDREESFLRVANGDETTTGTRNPDWDALWEVAP